MSNTKRDIPDSACAIRTYAEWDSYARKFAEGKFNLLGIVGTPGLSKTRTITAAMQRQPYTLINSHATAFVLYKTLYDHRDDPVVIDDADTLYDDRKVRPLLKALCETSERKTIAWHSKAIDNDEYPRSFTTTSRVVIICNEWAKMSAVTDRGIFLFFNPTPLEVHRQVAAGGWLDDDEVYNFVGQHLRLVTTPSMRYYVKAKELKAAGVPNWRDTVLNMLNPHLDNKALEWVSKLTSNPDMTEAARVTEFKRRTGLSRPTYFRYKAALADGR